MDFSNL